MDENLINEYRQSGWSEEDIDLLRGIDSMADTINMIPDDMDEFAKEYSKKVSNGTKEGFEAIGLNADEMAQKFAKGGDSAKEALNQVLDGLGKMEDPIKQDAAGVALFGKHKCRIKIA